MRASRSEPQPGWRSATFRGRTPPIFWLARSAATRFRINLGPFAATVPSTDHPVGGDSYRRHVLAAAAARMASSQVELPI